jgi:hypothetical protein
MAKVHEGFNTKKRGPLDILVVLAFIGAAVYVLVASH